MPEHRKVLCGDIRDYLPNRYVRVAPGKEAKGYLSDDTQLAFWTLEQMIADCGFVPENVADKFCRQRIFGIGSAVSEFIANQKKRKNPGTKAVRSLQAMVP